MVREDTHILLYSVIQWFSKCTILDGPFEVQVGFILSQVTMRLKKDIVFLWCGNSRNILSFDWVLKVCLGLKGRALMTSLCNQTEEVLKWSE